MSSIFEIIKAHRGNLHKYFGMELDYINQVVVNVSMLIYIYSGLQEFP